MKSNAWNNVTLSEFAQIRAILADEGRTQEDKMIALAAVMQGVDEDTILTMPLDKVQPVFDLVRGLNEKPQHSKVRRSYHLGKWDLVTTDRQMTVAQWIDFQNFAREDFESHLVDILSVVLVPVGKTYNEGYDMAQLKKDLEGMAIGDALAVCFFFQRKFLKSIKRTLTFLVGATRLKKETRPLTKICLKLRRETSAMLHSL